MGELGPPSGVSDWVETLELLGSASMIDQVFEYHPFFVLYCLNLDEKLKPPSSFVEAFGGEVDCVDWHLPCHFEVRNPTVQLRE